MKQLTGKGVKMKKALILLSFLMIPLVGFCDWDADSVLSTNTVAVNTTAIDANFQAIEAGTALIPLIRDDDGDTQVQVEEAADEDKIRFDIGGTGEVMVLGDGINEAVAAFTASGTSSPQYQFNSSGNAINTEINSDGNQTALYVHSDTALATGYSTFKVSQTAVEDSEVVADFTKVTGAGTLARFYDTGAGNTMYIYHTGATGYPLQIGNDGASDSIYDDSGAHLTAAGTWTDASSKDIKTNFVDVTVLDKINDLDIQQYVYKKFDVVTDVDGKKTKVWNGDFFNEKHIGPCAENFYEVFGTGDDKSLAAKDIAGVALKACVELLDKVETLEKRIEELEAK